MELSFLCKADEHVVEDFAKVAARVISKGERPIRGYVNAAKQLKLSTEEVEHAVLLLSSIFIRAVRSSMSGTQLLAYLTEMGYQDPARNSLCKYFNEKSKEIKDIVALRNLSLPRFVSLHWRLDLQIASRSLRNQAHPSFLIKLSTRLDEIMDAKGHKTEADSHYFEVDYATLKSICDQLDHALAESRSAYARRLVLSK